MSKNLEIGIIGLPNVGKSTLFNALTNNNVLAANYPFATIEPNTGIVPVPDIRLKILTELYKSKKTVPATVKFVDIAGLVEGASRGEGMGNQFLGHIHSCSAICHVVRAFSDSNVIHTDSEKDPQKDIAIITTELILADLQTLAKRIPKAEKECKTNPKLKPILDTLLLVKQKLDEGFSAYAFLDQINLAHIRDLHLLSAKPIIYLFNVDDDTLIDKRKQQILSKLVTPAPVAFISAKLESEIRDLEIEDQKELLLSYGVEESGLHKLIHLSYDLLNLQSYLTAGEDEIRAWTIEKGSTAPQAAGVIHGDFEKGFIAAQVVDYNDLIDAGSESNARSLGKMRTEGKDYMMQPNDIVEFRFNVSK
ncbi:MAG: redox-regulated ATPase YchF [Candidatus Saccharimonadales bacterium]